MPRQSRLLRHSTQSITFSAKRNRDENEVRQGEWIAVQENTSSLDSEVYPLELFNLKEDVEQRRDLAGLFPEKVDHFKKRLLEARSRNGHFIFG
ncbi:MAG: hypothetical protein ACON39_06870 [Coraliomargaritaceae bacterium]